jgi:molybdate-binding protein
MRPRSTTFALSKSTDGTASYFKGYLQQQGIITRKGELISPLDDLTEAQFINRNAGQELGLTNMLL